ncbi:MAG: hypothetical protein ACRDHS_03545 [Actinomycetota bacterium]
MRPALRSVRDLRSWALELEAALNRGVDEVQAWLATPQGRFFRALAARLLLVAAPLVVRHPFFKTPVGRLVELAGGAALLVKLAEYVREWEPPPQANPAVEAPRPPVTRN